MLPEIGHLTKHVFTVTRDQAMNLEIPLKIHTNVYNFETVPQNHLSSEILWFPRYSLFHLSFFQIVGTRWDFTITKLIKNFKSTGIWFRGNAVSKWETFVWILNHISRSITWSVFTLKASYLVRWPISTLPDIKPWRARYKSINYGISNYWST